MGYKLITTDEMDALLDERVNYLIDVFKNEQAELHLLVGVEEVYNNLEINPNIYRESLDPFMKAFHYHEAKIADMDYILIYKIVYDSVYILGIFHSLENYSEKMETIWGTTWE